MCERFPCLGSIARTYFRATRAISLKRNLRSGCKCSKTDIVKITSTDLSSYFWIDSSAGPMSTGIIARQGYSMRRRLTACSEISMPRRIFISSLPKVIKIPADIAANF